jgi:hypothetical protein
MLESRDEESPRELTGKSAYWSMLYALPVLITVAYFGNFYIGIGAAICAGLVFLVIRTRWDLRRYPWFWITILFMFILQTPFVILIPWKSRNLTGITMLPFAVADYCVVYGWVKLAEKVMRRPKAAD